jgi:hypothetical protein
MSDTPVVARGRFRANPRPKAEPEVVREPVRAPIAPVAAHGRSRRRKGSVDRFHVPAEAIPEGWTYQWCRKSIFGQPDIAHQVGLQENGWTPVPSDRHKGLFMPTGHVGDIERDGLVLMERPSELTAEARAEDKAAADALTRMQQEQLGMALPQAFDRVKPDIRTGYERGPAQAKQAVAID